jgi:hypothetical protein
MEPLLIVTRVNIQAVSTVMYHFNKQVHSTSNGSALYLGGVWFESWLGH